MNPRGRVGVGAICAGVFLACAGSVIGISAATGSTAVDRKDLAADVKPDPIKAEVERERAEAEKEAAGKSTDSKEGKAALAEKERMRQAMSDEEEHPATIAKADCSPTVVKDGEAAPISGALFVSNSRWSGVVGTDCVTVYAGQPGSENSGDGAVFVFREPLDGSEPSGATVLLRGSGPLSVVSFDKTRIRLRDGANKTHVFDAVSGSFVG